MKTRVASNILFMIADNQIRDKVKVLLDLSNYTTKKLEHTAGADAPNLTAKKDFVTLKAQVEKLGINKLLIVPTGLNNLKVKVKST